MHVHVARIYAGGEWEFGELISRYVLQQKGKLGPLEPTKAPYFTYSSPNYLSFDTESINF